MVEFSVDGGRTRFARRKEKKATVLMVSKVFLDRKNRYEQVSKYLSTRGHPFKLL